MKEYIKINEEIENIYPDGNAGKLIQLIRNSKGLTQQDLGDLIGASYKTISKWETDKGFPEIYYRNKLCEVLGITLEELHTGKYNIKRRKIEKRNKLIIAISTIFIIVLLFLIGILTAILIYTRTHYSLVSTYYLDIEESYASQCNIDGLFVKGKDDNVVYISSIKLLDYEVSMEDIIDVTFYYNDEIIYYTNNLENIIFKMNKDIPINDINLKVTIKNKSRSNYEENFNLSSIDFDIHDLPSFKKSKYVSDVVKKLLKMGFKKTETYTYKYIKDNIRIFYFADKDCFEYVEDTDDFRRFIVYLRDMNRIEATIYSKSSKEKMLIEKYVYYIDSGEKIEYVGKAYSLKDVLKIMEPYLNLRIGE